MAAKVAAPLPFRRDVRGLPLGRRSPGGAGGRSGLPGGLCWGHGARRRIVAPAWPARARGRNRSGGRSATRDDERAEEEEEEAAEAVLMIDGEDEEADEFDDDDLSGFRGLVLDLSYRPVNVVCWKRAICLEFMEKADVLEYYDQTVSSPSGSFYIPAVLRVPQLLQVVKRRRVKQCLSRKNILYRDGFICQHRKDVGIKKGFQNNMLKREIENTFLSIDNQEVIVCIICRYCSSEDDLTIDHVIPTSRGGKWEWENLVTACSRCNSRKGHKTLLQANMKLRKIPKVPKEFDIIAVPLTKSAFRTIRRRQGLPEEWLQYLAGSSP